jgi:hypothetical protein
MRNIDHTAQGFFKLAAAGATTSLRLLFLDSLQYTVTSETVRNIVDYASLAIPLYFVFDAGSSFYRAYKEKARSSRRERI